MNRKGMMALVAALILGLGAAALAQNKFEGKRGGMRGQFGQRMAEQLGLTDAQKTQIQQIMQAEKTKTQSLREELRSQHQQLAAATKGGAFDEAQVRTRANQQAQTQANLIVERERVKAQIFQILTPEQRTKAEQLHSQFGERMHNRGFRGQHAQPPAQQQ